MLRDPTNKEVIAILALRVDDVLIAWDEKKYPQRVQKHAREDAKGGGVGAMEN